MKKEYMEPRWEVVMIDVRGQLLAGSGVDGTLGGEATGAAKSRGFDELDDEWSDW
jgi:hypothetical protein